MAGWSQRFGKFYFTYDADGNIIYMAFHPNPTAPLDATDWEILKHTYSDGYLMYTQGPLNGSITNQANLDWS